MLNVAMIAPDVLRPLLRTEYERMVALGWFADERIELLQGVLVKMSPQGPRHIAVIRRLLRLLVLGVGERAEVQPQGPLALTNDSEPEPDVALVPIGYADELPSQAYLVIEVADSSLAKDRSVKAPLYASAGVPEYWIVNITDRVIEVHRDAQEGVYRQIFVCRPGDAVEVASFPDIRIAVADVV